MKFTETAQAVYERGVAAFQRMRVRPQEGHTAIVEAVAGDHVLQFGCVVGAIAFEAAALQELSNAKQFSADDNEARKWVSRLFGVDDEEVREIESGFDHYFEYRQSGGVRSFEQTDLDRRHEMFQVGWAVGKRAMKYYTDLDKAETEAWQLYEEKNLKSYKPRGRFISQAEIDALIAKWRIKMPAEDCPEGEECEELVPVA